ncbi:ferredoxin reductase-like protein [Auriculariales sp. MPI-PUGE-AT-0066]|nr:ferredoxin reductase-like protein [Auriculariales sp. MPI-PUGE-AT-0066]
MALTRRFVQLVSVGAAGGLTFYTLWPDPSKAARTSAREPMAPTHFTPATLTSSTACPGPSKLLSLTLSPTTLPTTMPGAIWSVYVKDSDMQIERPYTPLEGISSGADAGTLKFWVKRYEGGEVSRWLCSRNVGETLELRGPVQTWAMSNVDSTVFDEIILISGGTGITPFYQLLHSIFGSQRTESHARLPHCTLIHSSPSTSTLPPPQLLDQLASWARLNPRSFTMQVCVDAKDRVHDVSRGLKVHEGRIETSVVEQALLRRSMRSPHAAEQASQSWLRPWRWKWRSRINDQPIASSTNRVLFVVCGPDVMVRAIAGPKGGPTSASVLGRLGFSESQIVRL